MVTILYQNDEFVAVNKPNGLLVHRTSIADDADTFALQQTRDLTGRMIYPVHRLDRPTSGVLLFAFSSAEARRLNALLTSHHAEKRYTALVRGWMKEAVDLSHPVKSERGGMQEAHTLFTPKCLFRLPIPVGPYPEARFTEVEAVPYSGRWHQIRQHAAHLRHYIINDRVHGEGKNNKLFKEQLNINPLFLHAVSLTLLTAQGETLCIQAPFPPHWASFHSIAEEL